MEYLGKSFRHSPKVVGRFIDDEVIIVPIGGDLAKQDSIYNLESVAAHIWRMLDGKTSVKQIRDYMVKTMEVSSEQAESDLIEFLEELKSIGAIEETE
jgi:3-deoxy-D-manno-octulosonate 8-phosphate phosphatase KdsC-like HAD superfamily phosphatase